MSFADAALAVANALKADPGCIEAHLSWRTTAGTDDEQAHLAKAMETGDVL